MTLILNCLFLFYLYIIMSSILLANIIYIFHILVILFVLLAPFTNIVSLLVLHFVFSLCLLVHWNLNENICALSVFESYLRGMDRQTTFTHSFIAPIYDIGSSEWGELCTLITIVMLFISLYKIIISDRWKETIQLCKNVYKSQNSLNLIEYIKCFLPLLK